MILSLVYRRQFKSHYPDLIDLSFCLHLSSFIIILDAKSAVHYKECKVEKKAS